jgi:hypothetical protein
MANLTFSKSSIPLWTGSNGSINVDIGAANPAQPVDRNTGVLLNASFGISGGNKASFGSARSVQLGFDANTSVKLASIWNNQNAGNASLDQEFGISAGLDNNTVAMTLEVGAKADLSLAGSFRYGVLSVGAEIDAGVGGRFVCVRPYPRPNQAMPALQPMLSEFFGHLALPGTLTQAPGKGELYYLEMSGSLQLAVNASAGYSIKGTKDFDLLNLKLSEAYDLSVLGKLAVTGQIAGRFSVQVKAGAKNGWANVQVFRKQTSDLQVAADITIGATSQLGGLPQTGKEFLGALLGVNAKNWLNLVDNVMSQAGQVKSGADLETKLDGLADIFVSRYVNQAIGTIAANTPQFSNLMTRLQNVVNSYQNLDSSAIALFDRYFDVVTHKADQLVAALGQIQTLNSLQDFGKNVQTIDPVLWNVFQQLTNGDPLTAILENPIAQIQKKVNDTLALVQNQAHSDIRDFITLAKSQFGIDSLFNEIAKFDSISNLQTQANDEVQHLIQRLTNTVFNQIPAADLQKVLNMAKQISDGTAAFWKHFDDALTAASSQSFTLELNAAWERSGATQALIDVDINLQDPAGIPFLQAAGRGDFSKILADYNPNVIALNKGSLTHNLKSSSGVKINIVGWHLNFQYQNSFQVLTQADQQIRPTDGGRLNVFTTIDMQAQQNQMRKTTKTEQQLNTNFTLRFLAETNNIIDGTKFDSKHKEYLIDVITGYAALYNMTFTDTNTTKQQLLDALAFAKTAALDTVGATLAGVAPMLQPPDGPYGKIEAEYRVMFTPQGLKNLFAKPIDQKTLRGILKPIVLANYIGQDFIESIGWMYANDDVEALWRNQQENFVDAGSVLASANIKAVSPIPSVPIPTDPTEVFDVSTNIANRSATVVLFRAEASLFAALSSLQTLVEKANAGQTVSTNDLTKSANAFGNALNLLASMANGQNTTFAVMDGLIQNANPGQEIRSSVLALTTDTGGQERHLLFQLEAPAPLGAPTMAAAASGLVSK